MISPDTRQSTPVLAKLWPSASASAACAGWRAPHTMLWNAISDLTTPSGVSVAAIWQAPPITRCGPKAASSVAMCEMPLSRGSTQVWALLLVPMAGVMAAMLLARS